ncbi:MAG TPA: hypothetical protein VK789_14630 [Bryobacteraceae bacterium]|nr:hypothetical protein [Bryobacteraceae bacterium]
MAISIDDGLLPEADETARQMGLSRNRLFTLAVSEFLARQWQERMLTRLNEVCGAGMDEQERNFVKGAKVRLRRTIKDPSRTKFATDRFTG